MFCSQSRLDSNFLDSLFYILFHPCIIVDQSGSQNQGRKNQITVMVWRMSSLNIWKIDHNNMETTAYYIFCQAKPTW
jgi:hypothetical protein